MESEVSPKDSALSVLRAVLETKPSFGEQGEQQNRLSMWEDAREAAMTSAKHLGARELEIRDVVLECMSPEERRLYLSNLAASEHLELTQEELNQLKTRWGSS